MSPSGGKSSTPSGSSDGPADDESSAAGGAGKGGGGGNGGEGAPGSGPAGESDVGAGQAIAAPDPASGRGDDGSPLVPILVVLAVLAAISIGIVTMRRRQQGGPAGGSRFSPEAG